MNLIWPGISDESSRVDKRFKEEGEGATLEEGSQELVVAQVNPPEIQWPARDITRSLRLLLPPQ